MPSDLVKQPLLSGFRIPPSDMKQESCKFKRKYKCYKSVHIPDIAATTEKQPDGLGSSFSQPIMRKPQPRLVQVFLALTVYVGIVTFCFYLVRDQIKGSKRDGVLDAFYLCIVTMTTVGYGDLVPNSVLAKLLSCVFVFSGMALVCIILSRAADYLVEKQEHLFVKILHAPQKVGPIDIVKKTGINQVKYKFLIVALALVLLIIVGTLFMCLVEKLTVVDSFYFVCSTITTLGYGDKAFSTRQGRIFAVFWILASSTCIGQFFLYMAELSTEHRQHMLANWVLTRKMTNVDLEAADFDHDGVVSASEFVIFKLKEMGKISDEDIALVMDEFEKLDVDQSGTLTPSDLEVAQSPEQRS